MRIGFFGADERMRACAALAEKDGHTPLFYTKETGADPLIRAAELLVLPLPASRDGIRLCGSELCFFSLPIPREMPVFGGFIPKEWKTWRNLYDCADEEDFTWANAALTAEGGIATVLGATGRGFYGMRIAVCGFGRIAKLLLQKLNGFAVPLTVYARSDSALAEASLRGYTAKKLTPETVIAEEILFNTIPSPVFDAICAPNGIVCCDLGGGMPASLYQAEGKRLAVIAARGVPGVFAPLAAGEILYRSLARFIQTLP